MATQATKSLGKYKTKTCVGPYWRKYDTYNSNCKRCTCVYDWKTLS